MAKALVPLGWLALTAVFSGVLTGSQPADDGVNLDLSNHFLGWPVQQSGYGGPAPVAFEIEAPPVKGLHPGATKPMKLVITNPNRFDLKIMTLYGSVRGTSKQACAPVASNLVVKPYQGTPALPLTVRAHGRKSVGSIALYMPNSVANGCQGTTFTIKLVGTGTKVQR